MIYYEIDLNFEFDFVYGKCIFFLIFVCFLIFLSVSYWTFDYLIRKRKDWRNCMILSISVIYETLYSNIVNLFAKSITCTQIGDEFYNSQNLNILCSDDVFFVWVIKKIGYYIKIFIFFLIKRWSIAFPIILSVSFLIPFIAIIYLKTNKSGLNDMDIRMRFGFLYNGYRLPFFFW